MMQKESQPTSPAFNLKKFRFQRSLLKLQAFARRSDDESKKTDELMNGFHSPNGKGDTQDGVSEPSVSTGTPPKKHNLKDLKSFRKGRLNMRNSPSSKFESDSTSIMSPASDSVRTVPETPEFPHVTKQEGIFRMDDKDHDDSSPESPFFCKKKRRIIFESDGESSDGERPEKSPTSHLTSHYTVNEDSGEERDIITRKGTKRKPLLSDSSDEEERHKEVKKTKQSKDNEKVVIPGIVSHDMNVEEVERHLQFLVGAFPSVDPLMIQDVLVSNKFDVNKAVQMLGVKESNEEAARNEESDEEEDKGCQGNVYDSDDSDEESRNVVTGDRRKVLEFFQTATEAELALMPRCSEKKAQLIVSLRPFCDWPTLVKVLEGNHQLSTALLNGAETVLRTRAVLEKLMNRCQEMSEHLQGLVAEILEKDQFETAFMEQPKLLNPRLKLAPYQSVGVKWLQLMDQECVNPILADEMGLGKTVQSIAFLAHLASLDNSGPHLVVVPSSTLDNWLKEFHAWCPELKVLVFHGIQQERMRLKMEIVNHNLMESHDIFLTTYSMVASKENRVLWKALQFHYAVFDEAHMLKNITTQRSEQVMKIQAERRLLLTGTPLQNNLVELISLLMFVMPNMFSGKRQLLVDAFNLLPKVEENEKIPETEVKRRKEYEWNRILQAKQIMQPFFLRREKAEVLGQLPSKTVEVQNCPMTERQGQLYRKTLLTISKEGVAGKQNGIAQLMRLRRAANHPLLLRTHYSDDKVRELAHSLIRLPEYSKISLPKLQEELLKFSDFQLHQTLSLDPLLSKHCLHDEEMLESGKFQMLDSLLPEMKVRGDRVLLFSQFTMLLDVAEEYLRIRNHSYLRLDGSTLVSNRQGLIEEYNSNPKIFVFLLSTKAGGLGINLTAANVVILHDLDFNPYNDRQAEDRCHRIGQTREVRVIKLVSENTVEEGILRVAQSKLKLERDLQETTADTEDSSDLLGLLKEALDRLPKGQSHLT